MHDVIGMKVSDQITGFKGTVIGRVEYITGCNQLLVQPPVGADGTPRESLWIDEQWCSVVDRERVVIDNGATPGFDKAPPKR